MFITLFKRLAACTIILIYLALPAAAQDAYKILAFGDSLTQGYGLPQEDGFVPVLQEWLKKNVSDQIVVINGGVSGDTTAGGRARIEWSLKQEVDAVIVELGGNDLLRGLSPEESYANLDYILQILSQNDLPVILVGLPAPGNYGPEYQTLFDAMYPNLAERYGVVLYPNFLNGLGEGAIPDAKYMQSDMTHPNAEGVGIIVGNIGPVVNDAFFSSN